MVSTGGSAQTLAAAGLPVTRGGRALPASPNFSTGGSRPCTRRSMPALLARRDRPDHLAALDRTRYRADRSRRLQPLSVRRDRRLGRRRRRLHREYRHRRSGADPGRRQEPRSRDRGDRSRPITTGCLRNSPPEMAASDGELRRSLARKAFADTAAYDAAIAGWIAQGRRLSISRDLRSFRPVGGTAALRREPAPAGRLLPHSDPIRPGLATARQSAGRELSYNNYGDADAAFELGRGVRAPAVAIVKHANPCGVAVGADLHEAWQKALGLRPG